jgi:hypothetical protein
MTTFHKCDFCEPEEASLVTHDPEGKKILIHHVEADIHICEKCVNTCVEIIAGARAAKHKKQMTTQTREGDE